MSINKNNQELSICDKSEKSCLNYESESDYEFDYEFNSSVWESDNDSECESVISVISVKSEKNKEKNKEKNTNELIQSECSICYDEIGCVNCVVTECGHKFHTSCLFKSFTSATDGCPLCRKELVENNEDEESEADDESEVDYSISYDEDEENDAKVSCEQVADKLTKMGYTMADLINYFVNLNVMEKDKEKYTDIYREKIQNSIFGILEGEIAVDYRDGRSYAEVVRASITPQTTN